MGSVLIPSVNKPTEGPCRLLKNVRWGTLLPLDVVSKKETVSRAPVFVKEVFGGKGNGLGKSRRMGFLLLTSWHF